MEPPSPSAPLCGLHKGGDLDFASAVPFALVVTHPYSVSSFWVSTKVLCFLCVSTTRQVPGLEVELSEYAD